MRSALKYAILAAALFVAAPAFADPSPIVVNLTQDEASLVVSVLDNAVKSGGLAAADKALPVANKIIAAGRVAAKADDDARLKAAIDAAKADKPKP